MAILELYQQAQKLIQEGIPHVVVTLVDVRASAPQDIGAKIIVTQDGIAYGTVGGGKVEAWVIRESQNMLNQPSENQHLFVTWNLQKDVGMTCGGEVRFFFERFCVGVWNICIFGAGHVAQALVPLLCQLPCRVHCVDPRQEWLDKMEDRRNLQKYRIEDPEEAYQIIPEGAFVALMTKGHSTDVPILRRIFEQKLSLPYLGMIGSDTKAFRVKKQLLNYGIPQEKIDQLRSPIGLKLGSNHPVEIAVSISAEMLKVRDEG